MSDKPCRILGGSYEPITFEVGLVNLPFDLAAEAFVKWQGSIGIGWRGLRETEGLGATVDAFGELTDLVATRVALLEIGPTWSAFFDNGNRGTDASAAMASLATIAQVAAWRAVSRPSSDGGLNAKGLAALGALGFDYYAPHLGGPDYFPARSVLVYEENPRRWKFSQSGEPLPGEPSSRYTARPIAARLDCSELRQVLATHAVDPFEVPWEHAHGLLLERPPVPRMERCSLGDAREAMGG